VSINNLEELAARLAKRLEEDILLCSTRAEHIRVTARANEAAELLNNLKMFTSGLVIESKK
jgi:hypothetical protein